MSRQWDKKLRLVCLVTLMLMCMAGPTSQAQTGANYPDYLQTKDKVGQDNPAVVNLQLLLRTLGGLLVVVALMVAALCLSKRVLPQLNRHAGKEIKILETTLLGPRKYLHVVKVANQRLLLGSTNDRINMLAHLIDDLAALDIEQANGKEEI